MQLSKCLIIYNPVSGNKNAENYLKALIAKLSAKGILALCYATQNEDDAFNMALNYSDKVDLIIALGGDGTLSRVAAGLLKSSSNKPLAFIPAGTTNDFAAGLGLSNLSEEEYINMAIEAPAIPFDMGLLNEKAFLYVAAFGAFSSVSYRTSQLSKNALGKLAYFIEALKDLSSLKTYKLKIMDSQRSIEGQYILGMVSNSSIVAGLVNMDARTDYRDGLFEILMVKSGYSAIDYAAVAAGLRNGDFSHPAILMFQSSALTIESDDKIDWTLDGEAGGSYKKTFIEVVNQAVSVRIDDRKDK